MDPNRAHIGEDRDDPADSRGPWQRFSDAVTRPPRRRRLDWYAAVAVTIATLLNLAVVVGTDEPATWQFVALGILIAAAIASWADVLPDRLARGAFPLRLLAIAVGVAAVLAWGAIAAR